MKIFLVSFILVMATASCSHRAKHAVYDMLHEKERQDCLQQGLSDCPHAERYDKYKQKRDELIRQ
ncbi:MAG: hypothetical protein OEW97_04165 [Gammaproteobacteria bacterium]|nr:hypothetical protein [Gammaproteobacteria bacterium]